MIGSISRLKAKVPGHQPKASSVDTIEFYHGFHFCSDVKQAVGHKGEKLPLFVSFLGRFNIYTSQQTGSNFVAIITYCVSHSMY